MTEASRSIQLRPEILAWGVVCVAAGAAVGHGQWLVVAGAAVTAVAFAAALASWRLALYALLAYIPFSGLAGLALHPDTQLGVALRDALFIAPLYAGFAAAAVVQRRRVLFPGAPVVALALLAVLVVAQSLNPNVPEVGVAGIGLKVWLAYVPLLFVGYHVLRTRHDLDRALSIMSVTAIVPVVFGVASAVLLYAGFTDLVYGLYGSAARDATQGFAEIRIGDAALRRVPSTFTSGAQYFAFTIAMIAVTYAWWQSATTRVSARRRGALWLLVFMAAFLSGTRGAFLFAPFLVLMILVLHPGAIRRVGRVAVASTAGLALVVGVTGIAAQALIANAIDRAVFNANLSFFGGLGRIFALTPFGLGTGTDTRGARVLISDAELFELFGGAWQESWWVKAAIELGVIGLVLVVVLFATLVVRGWHAHRRIRDVRLAAVSAAFLAVIVWNLIYGVKAQYMDFDPMNMYVWLFAGMLLRLPALEDR